MTNQDLMTSEQDLSPTLRRILVAAEIEFAERGFDGAGMKAIATRGDVSQALLHYHFGTKDRLYSEVIAHRSRLINAERLELLAQVDLAAGDAVEQVFEALFRPPLGPAGGAKPYARIFAGLIVGRERDRFLVKQHYDPAAQEFIDALQTAVNGRDRGNVAQGYSLAIGALVAVIARDGRLERLMGQEDDARDVEEILAGLVAFSTAGVRALSSA